LRDDAVSWPDGWGIIKDASIQKRVTFIGWLARITGHGSTDG